MDAADDDDELELSWTDNDKVNVWDDAAMTHAIENGQDFKVSDLNEPDETGHDVIRKLYVAGVAGSDALMDVTFTLEYLREGAQTHDTVNFTVLQVDLEAEGLSEAEEEDPGALVVRRHDGNEAPRKKITIKSAKPAAWSGEVHLKALDPDDCLKAFDAEEGGDEVDLKNNGTTYQTGDLPKDLWVQGDVASENVRDAVLRLFTTTAGGTYDDVKFTVVDLKILQNGQDITNTTHDEIVGKKISLERQLLPDGLVGGFAALDDPRGDNRKLLVGPGDDEHGPNTPGEVIPLGDLTQDSVDFYWKDGGDGRRVIFNVTIAGQDLECAATFDVKRPTATMSTVTGTVTIKQGTQSNYYLGLRFGTQEDSGITFNCHVDPPAGFQGTCCFVQIYNEWKRRNVSGFWSRMTGVGLDTRFPYGPSWFPLQFDPNPIARDSPDIQLLSQWDNVEVQDTATMWLMFKPEGNDSIWVPLRKVWWFWRASATNDGGAWGIDQGSASNSDDPESLDTTEYPEWTENISKHDWEAE